MMKKQCTRRIVMVSAAAFLLTACDIYDGFQNKTIAMDPDVENVPRVMVLDGKIRSGEFARIRISYSRDINLSGDVPFKIEEDAVVSLSTDEGRSEILTYVSDGNYAGSVIKGKVKTTYTMTVKVRDSTWSATTYMYPPPGFDSATALYDFSEWGAPGKTVKESSSYIKYSEMWWLKDDADERNFYFMTWTANGVHQAMQDWAIDDNRIVHDRGYLRFFNPVLDPVPNQLIKLEIAEIDKPTYNFYNMYEKIMRGLVSTGGVTPYNPVSNFGGNTMGNFRALHPSAIVLTTPPEPRIKINNGQVKLEWDANEAFVKYILYRSTKPGIRESSRDTVVMAGLSYLHQNLKNGTEYYYRLMVEDSLGNLSNLSGEKKAEPLDSLFPPEALKAAVTDTAVILSWETSPTAENYILHWNTMYTDSMELVVAESEIIENVTDTTLAHVCEKGNTCFYWVAAVGAGGVKSDLSNPASSDPEYFKVETQEQPKGKSSKTK